MLTQAPYYVVWSVGPKLGDGTPSGSAHRDLFEAQRVAKGRSNALFFSHGPQGPLTWSCWVEEVQAKRVIGEAA